MASKLSDLENQNHYQLPSKQEVRWGDRCSRGICSTLSSDVNIHVHPHVFHLPVSKHWPSAFPPALVSSQATHVPYWSREPGITMLLAPQQLTMSKITYLTRATEFHFPLDWYTYSLVNCLQITTQNLVSEKNSTLYTTDLTLETPVGKCEDMSSFQFIVLYCLKFKQKQNIS